MRSDKQAVAAERKLDAFIEDTVNKLERTLLTQDDFVTYCTQEKVRIRPVWLNKICLGGLRPGDTVLCFGRPGAAKTMLAVNIAAAFAVQCYPVLYVGNEEERRAIGLRFLSLLGGEKLRDMNAEDKAVAKAAIAVAFPKANALGLSNVHFLSEQTSLESLAPYLEAIRPRCLVIDQIRNVTTGGESMTSDLEKTMREVRKLARAYKLVGIGTAQATATAEGKEILSLLDLDASKTGVQGACDLMIGVGVTDDLRKQGRRILSVCRNKISGIIDHTNVAVDEQLTKIHG